MSEELSSPSRTSINMGEGVIGVTGRGSSTSLRSSEKWEERSRPRYRRQPSVMLCGGMSKRL